MCLARIGVVATLFALPSVGLSAQVGDAVVPDLAALIARPHSEMQPVLERWNTDRAALGRRYSVEYSPQRNHRYRLSYATWRERLTALPFDKLSRPAQVDYILLDNRLPSEQALLDRNARRGAEMLELLP